MKDFLQELSALMKKHEVEMEIKESSTSWGVPYPEGICFCQTSRYEDDVQVMDYCEHTVSGTNFDHTDFEV
jgi:hypothetical protein